MEYTEVTMVSVIVIDDEKDIRELSKNILSAVGYEVDLAEDGAIGLEMIKKRRELRKMRYNLIVTDVLMPNVSGLELCRILKEASHTKDIPVLMISAMGTGTRMMLSEESQADGYLQKPFTKSNLLEAVKQTLRDKRTTTI